MKTFEKLRLKLNRELGMSIQKDAVFNRVRAGREDRSAGAWSWDCYSQDYSIHFGSQFTATEILKAKKISISNSIGRLPSIWVDEI